MSRIVLYSSVACCAVGELSGLREIGADYASMEEELDKFLSMTKRSYDQYRYLSGEIGPWVFKEPSHGFYVFYQGAADSAAPYGETLKEVIEKNDLGEVIATSPNGNPVHGGRPVIMYVWNLDPEKMRKWWEKRHQGSLEETSEEDKAIEARRQKDAADAIVAIMSYLVKERNK